MSRKKLSDADYKKQMVLRTVNRMIAEGRLILDVDPNGEPVVHLPGEKDVPSDHR